MIAAVPAVVNCAVPSRWISLQSFAVVSQKFTWPRMTGAPAAVTVAVNVTTVPCEMVVTALLLAVTVSVVVVAACICAEDSEIAINANRYQEKESNSERFDLLSLSPGQKILEKKTEGLAERKQGEMEIMANLLRSASVKNHRATV